MTLRVVYDVDHGKIALVRVESRSPADHLGVYDFVGRAVITQSTRGSS